MQTTNTRSGRLAMRLTDVYFFENAIEKSSLHVHLEYCHVHVSSIDVVSLFDEILGERASLSMKVKEGDALAVTDGGLADIEASWLSTSPELMCPEVYP
ncbi:hypothetical protein Tco_0760159 [Tanacetum coccineum]